MNRKELQESAHSMIDKLSTRQLEAVIGVLHCILGTDESDAMPASEEGEGIPPADILNRFFS